MVDSAGLLLWRSGREAAEVLLGHMGGPFFAKKDDGGWTLPKGIAEDGETELLMVAEREFAEEFGSPAPTGPTTSLGSVAGSGKRIHVFARLGDYDADRISSNTFTLEWPPRSGRMQDYPEVDRAAWFDLDTAEVKLAKNQRVFIDRLRRVFDESVS